MDLQTVLLVLDSAIRITTPLLLAALAGLYSERSGVFDIGLEGKMLFGAFAAGSVAAVAGSAWLGLVAAILVSIVFALVHAFASITQRGNQIVSGVAINFLASGLTAFLGQAWFGEGGRTPRLESDQRFNELRLPFGAELRDIPVLGRIYADVISGHSLLVYFAFIAVPLTAWIIYRTRFGLRLRAVGENPAAVDTAGISVTFLRYRAVIITGVLCGFAGAYLSLAQSAGFGRDMTAGQGYIALAALIFANWRPWRVLGACFLFGLLNAAAIRLQGSVLPFIGAVPVQFITALPYILTVILLAGFIGKAVPPRAGGVPYVKER
jgi:general nucleoside transport system permease protein